MARAKSSTMALALGLLVMTLVGECYGQCGDNFKVGYYDGKCGKVNVEAIVFQVVKKHFNEDKDTIADLIRLQFHDCFVRGCDASILLEGEDTEKTARNNLSVDGYDIIEDAKVALDKYCPGVVSCADIIVLAARAATYLGGAEWYAVETGRKDGRTSLASDAKQLPRRDIPIPAAVDLFASFGLDTHDFVYLLGCHTVGTAHCENIEDRLYNFNGGADPTMNSDLASSLKMKCPRNANSTEEAFLDQTYGSEFVLDNAYFKRIIEGKGILKVDQELALDPLTKDIVIQTAADETIFRTRIGPSMRKMGLIGVLTEGEVRIGTCKKVR
ncbi:cationic peroxidase 2-like [Chenopodium quinoa]|uniref:Peroxidase n=1 Tax=Chenopodium quinoa TaxID=63459 RepID=A0A803LCZ9_CHEQI|nr:cationic peroxidase 2-like [Chenopodium quinoa]XP_021716334.1 cationic peroxidase 2-like [Chenopodium quinoa]XP_021716335.1 cationic peroxidase 2-like [Chenopodium quinoa]XP_021716336.1 cationic peroxidase 2-like [Chenopodium quinoa]XP_021716337.1 cationic peroxidase 2-like [Chenopodium quinoa]